MIAVRRLLTTLVVTFLLLPSCANDSGQSDPPHVTPSPTPSASQTTSTSPPHETPEQFIRRWITLQRDMQATGKTGAFLATSDSCESCRAMANTVRRIYAAGGSITTDGWIVRSIRKKAKLTYVVRIRDTGTTWQPSRTAGTKHLPGGEITSLFQLSRVERSWRVAVMGDVSS